MLPLLSVLAVTGWAAYFLESGAFERQTTVSASSASVQPAHPGGGGAGPARVMTEEAVKPAIPAPAAVPSVDTAAPIANDVSGRWKLETKVGSTRLRRFAGLQLGYQIDLNQKGGRVTGTGKKISENGKTLAARAQTPIRLAGKITDNKLIVSFTEGGRRVSRGGFAMQLDESGALRGRFSSNAARSSGTAEAHRQP